MQKSRQELTLEKNSYQAHTNATNAKKLYEATEKTVLAKNNLLNYAKERHDVGLMNTLTLIRQSISTKMLKMNQ